MQVHLVDGTYELFRYHFALPSHVTPDGREVAATRGVVGSMLGLLEDGATHVGVATDHVVESFRNELWPGYKTSEGMPADLLAQFGLLEDLLVAAGFTVFPMDTYEADDALGAAAARVATDPRVDRVLICTPDKDLGQCVSGDRVVQLDRRKGTILDAEGVHAKFGVWPASIPDYLALVGDSADGFPGLAGWGAKSTATVLDRYAHLEHIPLDGHWDVAVRGASKLAATLAADFERALLFRRLATIDRDAPTVDHVDELRWGGPLPELTDLARRVDAPALVTRSRRLADERG